ncbi:MAG: hypothetical protein ACRDUV_18965 [Pseudonocardiaceae bacterium]
MTAAASAHQTGGRIQLVEQPVDPLRGLFAHPGVDLFGAVARGEDLRACAVLRPESAGSRP